jgi:hypothetical protein
VNSGCNSAASQPKTKRGCLISQTAAIPTSVGTKRNSFRAVKNQKNRLRFFDFLPLFKILFAAAGGDWTYETAS